MSEAAKEKLASIKSEANNIHSQLESLKRLLGFVPSKYEDIEYSEADFTLILQTIEVDYLQEIDLIEWNHYGHTFSPMMLNCFVGDLRNIAQLIGLSFEECITNYDGVITSFFNYLDSSEYPNFESLIGLRPYEKLDMARELKGFSPPVEDILCDTGWYFMYLLNAFHSYKSALSNFQILKFVKDSPDKALKILNQRTDSNYEPEKIIVYLSNTLHTHATEVWQSVDRVRLELHKYRARYTSISKQNRKAASISHKKEKQFLFKCLRVYEDAYTGLSNRRAAESILYDLRSDPDRPYDIDNLEGKSYRTPLERWLSLWNKFKAVNNNLEYFVTLTRKEIKEVINKKV